MSLLNVEIHLKLFNNVHMINSNFPYRVYKAITINGKTVNRWMDLYWIREYDANGNEIHYKDSDGYEEWYEYDTKGNEIHYKNSDGEEYWFEYEYYNNGKLSKEVKYNSF